MATLPSYKDIWELFKAGATIEAQEKIMELRQSALSIQEENIELRTRILELEARVRALENVGRREQPARSDFRRLGRCEAYLQVH